MEDNTNEISAHTVASPMLNLESSEARFRLLAEQSPLSIQVLTPDGWTIKVNRAWEKLWGATLEMLADYNILHDPQLVEKGVLPYIRKAFAGEATAIPVIGYAPDRGEYSNKPRWVRAFIYPVKDEFGNVLEVVLMHEDVTEQHQSEQALRDSEERFRSAFAHAAVGMALTDLEGRFLQVNPAYCTITGYTEDELLALNIVAVTHPEDWTLSRQHLDHLMVGAIPGFILEKRYLRKDGTFIWAQDSVSLVRDSVGMPANIIRLTQDISERKRAQAALVKSEARARRLFEGNMVGVIHWNLDTCLITDANDVFLKMVGYTREDLAQGRLNWDEMTPPEWQQRNQEGVHEIRTQRSGAPYEKEYFRKDGSRVPIIIGGALFDDSPNEGVSFTLDISEQKRVENALRSSIAERMEYLQEIENLNVRLQRSIQETHHRVKNNLQIISALVELQVEEKQEVVPVAAMKRISQHTRSLAAIHDILTQQVKAEPYRDALTSRVVMERLIPLLQSTTGGRRISYEGDDVSLPARLGASLALLVAELISNAVKHGNGDIGVFLKANGAEICLEVCDDGPGFAPGFDWRVAANTGLGLIDGTVRHDLRGVVRFENRVGGGARVVVIFPASILPQDKSDPPTDV